jgi:hypothetical protein
MDFVTKLPDIDVDAEGVVYFHQALQVRSALQGCTACMFCTFQTQHPLPRSHHADGRKGHVVWGAVPRGWGVGGGIGQRGHWSSDAFHCHLAARHMLFVRAHKPPSCRRLQALTARVLGVSIGDLSEEVQMQLKGELELRKRAVKRRMRAMRRSLLSNTSDASVTAESASLTPK